MKTKEKKEEYQTNKENFAKTEERKEEDKKIMPLPPQNTATQFVSNNFYGNGHNEYIFCTMVGNGRHKTFVYWATNKQEYIELTTIEEPVENTSIVKFPNSEKQYKLYYEVGTIIVEDKKVQLQKFTQYN